MEILKIEGLSKNFGGVPALHNISLDVRIGERLAIIGPNGAGKTTLFNVLTGELPASAGRIYFYDKEITNLPTYRRAHLGMSRSFQITSLFLPLTVIDNCLLALHGMRPSRYQLFRSNTSYRHLFAKAQELLEGIALWDKRGEPVKNISYGDQPRLEIAVSLASEPKLLLLDEPSSGLTAGESTTILETIHDLGIGITVLMIAHDMDLVFGMAERIIVIHYGQIIAEGTPDKVFDDTAIKEIYTGTDEGE